VFEFKHISSNESFLYLLICPRNKHFIIAVRLKPEEKITSKFMQDTKKRNKYNKLITPTCSLNLAPYALKDGHYKSFEDGG